jgi:hypothetical protein
VKLVLTKDQSKGMMGGVSFEVAARVELESQEAELVKHYKLDNEILLQRKLVNIWGQPTDQLIDVRVKQLLAGQSFKCKSLDEVISYSDGLKSACETLKAYLEVARHFGGQETFEFK